MIWIIIPSSVAILVIVVLFAPFRLNFSWVGGLVELRLRFLGMSFRVWNRELFSRESPGNSDADDSHSGKGVGVIRKILKQVQVLMDSREVLLESGRIGIRLLTRFRTWWHFESGEVNVVIGMVDPALTGVSVGVVSVIGGLVTSRWPRLRVYCHSRFDTPGLSSHGHVIIRMRAWDPVRDVVRAAVEMPWRRLRQLKRDLAVSS